MIYSSRHIGVFVSRKADDVYEYASNPANLLSWAPGLATAIDYVDGKWVADSPMGKIVIAFVEPNPFGVLDHYVTLPSGVTVHNPMRVIAFDEGCEIVFTLRKVAGVSVAANDSDAALVAADLNNLKRVMERARL